MYGLVNKAIKDLVTSKFGEDKWIAIKAHAHVEQEEFVPLDTYEDAVTYRLVSSASHVLGVPANEVLRAFGSYWILFTAEEGYGELLDLFGQSLKDCLINLNQMHARMGAMMPNLKPPRFVVVDHGKQLDLDYYSTRAGLAPMVLGLIEGLASRHNTKVEVSYVARAEDSEPDRFKIVIK